MENLEQRQIDNESELKYLREKYDNLKILYDLKESQKYNLDEIKSIEFEKFRLFGECSIDIMVILDKQGFQKYISPSAEKITGFTVEELQQNFIDLIHPEDRETTICALKNFLINPSDDAKAEYRHIHKNGTYRYFEAVGRNYLDNPFIEGIITSVRDITERKIIENELKEKNEEYIELNNKLLTYKQKIEESELQSNAILNSIPDSIFIQDFEGVFTFYHSPTNLIHLEKKDIIGKNIKEILPNNVVNIININFQKAIQTKLNQVYEFSIFFSQKEYFYEASTSVLEKNKILSVVRNISKRKNEEQELQEIKNKFELIFNTEPDAIVISNVSTGIITDINDGFEKMSGYTRDEVISNDSKNINIYKNYNDRSIIEKELRTKGSCLNFETEIVRKDKSTGTVIMSLKLFNLQGIPHVLNVVRDISERKKNENLLQLSQEKYSKIFDLNPNSVALSKFETGEYIEVNKTFLNVFGLKKEEIIGKTSIELKLLDECTRNEIKNQILKQNKIDNFEIEIIKKDGEHLYGMFSCESIFLEEEKLLVTVLQDITKRKKAEISLLETEKKQRELIATKDKFFSIIAHDLKNPLSGFVDFSSLLIKNFDHTNPTKLAQYLEVMNKSAIQTYKLLENLLEWARSQRGQIDYNPEKIQLWNAVNQVIQLLKQTADSKKIAVILEIPFGIYVTADLYMIQTVLRNIIYNAIKFTEKEGSIVINFDQKDSIAVVSISDTGTGMNKSTIENLFKIDSKNQNFGTQGEKGTGLGLLLCKEFIDKHNGKIWAESTEGTGSTFYFTLNIAQSN